MGAPVLDTEEKIEEVAAKIKVTQFLSCREFLARLFEEVRKVRPKYSYRQYSQDLGFGYSNYLHLIVRGQRPVSVKAAQCIADALDFKGATKQYFVTLAKHASAKTLAEREDHFETLLSLKNRELVSELDRDQLEYFSEWYHPVIRELVGLTDFDAESLHIIERLVPHLTPEQVRKSLELLERIGYIKINETTNRYYQTKTHVRTPAEVRGIAIVRYHHQMLELARESIVKVAPQRRDISALTVKVTDDLAKEIKNDLQELRQKILDKSAKCAEADQVFQLNMQLFPFTKEGT